MNNLLKKLLKEYSDKDIETAFIKFFIESNKIKLNRNILLLDILNTNSKSITEIQTYLSTKFSRISFDELITVFELLIPVKDKKVNGAFYTPSFITEYMVRNTIKKESDLICDPSCGCGAFLISATKYLKTISNKSFEEIINKNIYGVDISKYSIRRAEILLSLLAVLNKEDVPEFQFNLRTANSLNYEWQVEFSNVFANGGFDVIIGNPPYVKFQDLDLNLRKSLGKNWTTMTNGNFNLYFAFFELGRLLLNGSGKLAFITPNNYFTSLAGEDLRTFFTENKLIEKIIDFNHYKVFDAQTYTCITFISKSKNVSFDYDRIDSKESIRTLSNYKFDFSKVLLNELNSKKWRLLKSSEKENIKSIENIGIKLKDIVDIRVGIATCRDVIYFIDSTVLDSKFYYKDLNGMKYPIEKDITKVVNKISDFDSQSELISNTRRIIFPYKNVKGKVKLIEEDELKKTFPNTYKYFLAAKKELDERDKGKVNGDSWYAYGRNQGLNFFGEKLLTPTFSDSPRFMLQEDPDSLFCNGYALYLKDNLNLDNLTISLEVLQKILNSEVMDYYIRKTSVSIEGGYYCYQKNFIEMFNVPILALNEIKRIANEKNDIILNNIIKSIYKVSF